MREAEGIFREFAHAEFMHPALFDLFRFARAVSHSITLYTQVNNAAGSQRGACESLFLRKLIGAGKSMAYDYSSDQSQELQFYYVQS
jgi:hypothetical protein